MIPKCKYCGKEYKLNTWDMLEALPKLLREKLKYIPDCDCFEKLQEEEMARLERERVRDCARNKVKKFWDISIIDKKFRLSTFENADLSQKHMRIAKKFAEKFVSTGTAPLGIMFFGEVGTGKTYASNCIANHLMKNGKTVFVISLSKYMNKLQREWAEAEKDVLRYVEECELLIIDDFGVEKASEFVLEKTFALIDTRYRTKKPMIITTNLDITKINNKFGERIADRLREMCYFLQVTGKSRRGADTEKIFHNFIR